MMGEPTHPAMSQVHLPLFQHGVASGDPLEDRVILWTRLTTTDPTVTVTYEVASDPEFSAIVAQGQAEASANGDHTVHVDPTGLTPDTRYYYRFQAQGQTSTTGRTRTLPGADISHLRFAQTSCCKFNAGFFNAYGTLAARDDLQFLLHLGDYIYEASNTPPAGQTPGADIGRPFEPLHECKTLADYRCRYNQYHRDPDLQAMHAALPVIATVDDHEFADGAWRGGADEHQDGRDGPWEDRVNAALQARTEWLPIRPVDPADPWRVHRSLHFGTLADLHITATRITRDLPVPGPEMLSQERTALGLPQRQWLFAALEASRAQWQLIGNPSVMATTWKADLPETVLTALKKTKLVNSSGDGPDYDQWDGYPAEREMIYSYFQNHPGNFVVLSGDIHVSMALEIRKDPYDLEAEPIAVEFVNTSITAQNFDDKMKWPPRTQSLAYEEELKQHLNHVKYVNLDGHGYNVVDVTPERVQVEWWHVDTVLSPSHRERCDAVAHVKPGSSRLVLAPA
jgi:alkaline phosphatase D